MRRQNGAVLEALQAAVPPQIGKGAIPVSNDPILRPWHSVFVPDRREEGSVPVPRG